MVCATALLGSAKVALSGVALALVTMAITLPAVNAAVSGFACLRLDAVDCAEQPRCTYHSGHSACLPVACHQLDSRESCSNDNNCRWNTATSMCGRVVCGMYHDQPLMCNAVERCRYSTEMQQCVGIPCGRFDGNMTACVALSTCQWWDTPASPKRCGPRMCSAYTNRTSCPNDVCKWVPSRNPDEPGSCQKPMCSALSREQCSIDRCLWDREGNRCIDLPCNYAMRLHGVCPRAKCNLVPGDDDSNTWNCRPRECRNFTAANCPMDTCMVNTTSESCVWKSCAQQSRLACDPRRCSPTTTGCMIKSCADYGASMCPSDRCMANHATGKCSPIPCERMLEMGSTCATARCVMTAGGRCVGRPCGSMATNMAMCVSASHCHWDYNHRTCLNQPCSRAMDVKQCNRPRCVWNNVTQRCSETPCTLLRATECNLFPHRCYSVPMTTTSNITTCMRLPCRRLTDAGRCHADTRCVWRSAQTADGLTNTSAGWCEAKSSDLPCEQRPATMCFRPQCAISPATGRCARAPCVSFGRSADACPSDYCAFNVSGSGVCGPQACRGTAQDLCEATSHCSWSVSSFECAPKTCDQLAVAECDISRCAVWTPPGSQQQQCRSVPCASARTADRCPAVECQWTAGLCAPGDCATAAESEQRCTALSHCRWLAPLSTCVPAAVLANATCGQLRSSALCAAASGNRCSWNEASATSTTRGGWCGLANAATDALPCYSYTTNGADACPSAVCEWRHETLCMSPHCYRFESESACKLARCLWLTPRTADTETASRQRCVDPQFMRQPCDAFAFAECPDGICYKNLTHCKAFDRTSTNDPTGTTTTMPVGAINPMTGLPITQADVVCKKQTSARDCQLMTEATCAWDRTANSCKAPTCAQFNAVDCPTTHCRVRKNAAGARICSSMCPATSPYFCAKSGTCAKAASMCRVCPSNQVQCERDSSCRASFTACPCPVDGMQRCPDTQQCVMNTSACSVSCAGETPTRCWDQSCAANETLCSCPPTRPHRCDADRSCVAATSDCTRQCPPLAPVRCWNGECAARAAACPCTPNRPFRCPIDGQCYAAAASCGCGTNSATTRCADGRCLPAGSDCNAATLQCPSSTPYRCPDGLCVTTRANCQCRDAASAVPTLTIATRDQEFDTSRPLSLAVRVNYTVCGSDRRLEVRVRWSVSNVTSGDVIPGTNRWGHNVALPPRFFTDGEWYVVTAAAFVESSTSPAATAMIRMRASAPAASLKLMGGTARTVPSTGIRVGAKLENVDADALTNLLWMCCAGDDADTCTDSCPAALADATANATGQASFAVSGTVPAGTYTLIAVFQGQRVTQQLVVSEQSIPRVQIVSPRRQLGTHVVFYAWARNSGSAVTTSWYVNGSLTHTGAVLRMEQPSSATWIAVRACPESVSADSVDSCGNATLRYEPPTRVVGTCALAALDGTSAANWTALTTNMRVASTWTTTSETLRFAFVLHFNVTRGDRSVMKRVMLAPFESELSDLEFKFPMLPGNSDDYEVRVGVVARYASSRRIVASAWCDAASIQQVAIASDSERDAFIANKLAELRQARDNNDTSSAFDAVNTAVSFAERTDANRTEVTREVLSTLRSLVVNRLRRAREADASAEDVDSTVTRPERTAAIQSLAQLLALRKARGDAPDQDTQNEAAEVLLEALNATGEDSAIDVDEVGETALDALANLDIDETVANAADQLARRTASAAEVGERKWFASENITVAGTARVGADLEDASVSAESCEMRLPRGFVLSGVDETNAVSLAAVRLGKPPRGESDGVPSGSEMATDVAELNMLVDGQHRPVSGLPADDEIEVVVPMRPEVANTSQPFVCRFWDKVSDMWSTQGVRTVGFNATRGGLVCKTAHLTSFGGTSSSGGVSPTTASGGSPATPPPAGPSTTAGSPATPPPAGATPTPPPAPATTAGGGGTPATPTPTSPPAGPSSPTTQPPAAGATPAPPPGGNNNGNNNGNAGAQQGEATGVSMASLAVGAAVVLVVSAAVGGFVVMRAKKTEQAQSQQASQEAPTLEPYGNGDY